MTAPTLKKEVMDKLRAISPRLSVEWGADCERWIIFEKNRLGQKVEVFRVQDEAGNYRPIDERVYQELRFGDTSKYRNHAEIVHNMRMQREKFMNMKKAENELAKKRFVDEIKHHAKTQYFYMGAKS